MTEYMAVNQSFLGKISKMQIELNLNLLRFDQKVS